MNLQGRVSRIEAMAAPCFMAQTCNEFEGRFGRGVWARAFAAIDRDVVRHIKENFPAELKDVESAYGSTAEEMQRYFDSLAWGQDDEELHALFLRFSSYLKRGRRDVPLSFLPFEPRSTENEKSKIYLTFMIEVDAQAREMWLQMLQIAERIAAACQ